MKQSAKTSQPLRGKTGKDGAASDRRNEAVNAAIEVLAEQGARGLTHREIDRYLGWPLGSTSNYMRRRNDIFIAIAAETTARDVADMAIVGADLDKPGGLTVDQLVSRMVYFVNYSMTPGQRSRSLARAEILFEATRNEEVQEAAQVQFEYENTLFQRVFEQLGSADPVASARFLMTMMPCIYVGLSIASHLPDAGQIEATVRSWVAIALERPPITPRVRKTRPASERQAGPTKSRT